MSTPEVLRVALDRLMTATDPEEKEQARIMFDRLFLAAMRHRKRTAPDWQRAAAGDQEDA